MFVLVREIGLAGIRNADYRIELRFGTVSNGRRPFSYYGYASLFYQLDVFGRE